MNSEPIIIERTYPASVEKIWKAITDKNEMKLWYFDLAEFKPEAGFEFRFEGGTEDRTYLHICIITEVVPLKKLKHSWRYDGFEGISYVTFELLPEGKITRVKLTHSGLESFPASNPDFAKHNFEAGWAAILGTSLKDYLEKKH